MLPLGVFKSSISLSEGEREDHFVALAVLIKVVVAAVFAVDVNHWR
jgi:hypothetical protein